MTKSSEILSVAVRHSNASDCITTEFSVEPPLTEEEIVAIGATQGHRSVLGEALAYRSNEPGVDFIVPSSNYEHAVILGKELAYSILSIRGLSRASIKHESWQIDLEI